MTPRARRLDKIIVAGYLFDDFASRSGSFAMFAATRRASFFVNRPISNRRVGFSSSK
jgi:hypothetical protein